MILRVLAAAMVGIAAWPAAAQSADAPVVFGDDASEWSNDGECDDPRFIGDGMTNTPLLDSDRFHDASDCRAAYEAGTIHLAPPEKVVTSLSEVDFGDDSSTWANDNECDDPRFEGPGMTTTTLLEQDRLRDASDCRAAYEAGDITLIGEGGGVDPDEKTLIDSSTSGIDFGDDSSMWSNDGECDDPRFIGSGMTTTTLLDSDRLRDATDCRTAFEAGNLRLRTADDPQPGETSEAELVAVPDGLNFGDNSSRWARDGECDDPRFEGPASAAKLLPQDTGRDADDCRAAFTSGSVALTDGAAFTLPPVRPSETINFGDNSSRWARDGECDDPRFEGDASAVKLAPEDLRSDALDCRAAYENGRIRYVGD